MSRKKPTARVETLFFNVTYEDGTLSSNRKILATQLDNASDDDAAQSLIEAQDREIGERSGRPRPRIKAIARVRDK